MVDDHPLFLKGLKMYLQRDSEIAEVFTATAYDEIFQLCSNTNFDVILMDINLGKENGIQYTKKVKSNFPNMKIIGISANNDESQIQEMIDAGAKGFVLKDVDIDELKVALQFVMKGKSYFSSSIQSPDVILNTNETSKTSLLKKSMTSREFEILSYLIEEELGNKEIAEKLFISPRTVETHKRNLIRKLKVKNSIGLAKFYIENGYWLKEIYGFPVA